MTSRYIIKANKKVPSLGEHVFVETHLTSNHGFQVASYTGAKTFRTPEQAALYMKDKPFPGIATDEMPWIEGPRGGRYSIFTGRKLR